MSKPKKKNNMSLRNQEGKLYAFTEPTSIKEKYKKAQIVISYQEKKKDGTFITKLLPLEVFGEAEKFDKRWNYFTDKFSKNDNVKVAFDVGGSEWKDEDGNIKFFPSIKLINMEHGERQESSEQPDNSVPEDDDGLPF